jgi:hypothetical protein
MQTRKNKIRMFLDRVELILFGHLRYDKSYKSCVPRIFGTIYIAKLITNLPT